MEADDKKDQNAYVKALRKKGKVVVVESGLELIKETKEGLPDLILISKDFESIRDIRSISGGWEIPIILLIKRDSFGANDCVTNRINSEELANKAEYWLDTDIR